MSVKTVISINIILALSFTGLSQIYLPVNENGEWSIRSEYDEVILPQSMDDVGNFDKEGYAVFIENGNYGVIRADGSKVIDSCLDVEQLQNGFYRVQNNERNVVVNLADANFEPIGCYSSKFMDVNWFLINGKDSSFIQNTVSAKQIFYNPNADFVTSKFGYVQIYKDSTVEYYDVLGEPYPHETSSMTFLSDYVVFRTRNWTKVILNHGPISLPANAANIQLNYRGLKYSSDGFTYLMDVHTKEIVESFPFDNVTRTKQGYYLVQKGTKMGVMDANSDLIIEPEFDYIQCTDEYFKVRNDYQFGLISSNGKKRTKVEFGRIDVEEEYIHVRTPNNFKGLLLRKNFKSILEPVYNSIIVEDDKVKGILGTKMKIFYLDDNYNITKELIIPNAVYIDNGRSLAYGPSNNKTEIDQRLFSQGWYYDTLSRLDINGNWDGFVRKWGLRNRADSMLIRTRFPQPKYYEGASLNTVAGLKKRFRFFNRNCEALSYTLIDNLEGKILAQNIIHFDTADFFDRNYVRFLTSDTWAILKSDNQFATYSYIDQERVLYPRVCSASYIEPAKGSNSGLFVSFNIPGMKIVGFNRRLFGRFNMVDGKWNYLDSEGDKLFAQDFIQAEKYFGNTALVKGEKGWGVVSTDTIIVPLKFAKISRLSEQGDSVFLVKRNNFTKHYMDEFCNPLEFKITRILKNNEHFTLAQTSNGLVLLNAEKNKIIDGISNCRLYDDKYVIKRKKVYYIYDSEGHEVGSVKFKPLKFMANQHILYKVGSRFGVVDFDGNVIIQPINKSIEEYGNKVLVIGPEGSKIYDTNFQLKFKSKEVVLVDKYLGNILVKKGGKSIVYDKNFEHVSSIKIDQIIAIHGQLIVAGTTRKRIYNLVGEELAENTDIRDVVFFNDGKIIVTDMAKYDRLYLNNFSEVSSNKKVKRIQDLGNNWYSGRSKQDMVLFNGDDQKTFEKSTSVGSFSSDRLLIKAPQGYLYVDNELNVQFDRVYRKAYPFNNGYASISDHRGWTVIDEKGRKKSYPGFTEIKQVSTKIFESGNRPYYGLYSSSGLEIVPCNYHRIKIINDKIIQVRLNGNISYIDWQGNAIFEKSLTQR